MISICNIDFQLDILSQGILVSTHVSIHRRFRRIYIRQKLDIVITNDHVPENGKFLQNHVISFVIKQTEILLSHYVRENS